VQAAERERPSGASFAWRSAYDAGAPERPRPHPAPLAKPWPLCTCCPASIWPVKFIGFQVN